LSRHAENHPIREATPVGGHRRTLTYMGSLSFLAHKQALARGHGRSNCQTLFGMSAIPSDNYIRLMLAGISPAAFDGLFTRAVEAAGPLTRFQCLGGRRLVALDGSEYFCSRRIKCKRWTWSFTTMSVASEPITCQPTSPPSSTWPSTC